MPNVSLYTTTNTAIEIRGICQRPDSMAPERKRSSWLASLLTISLLAIASRTAAADERNDHFEGKIRPILAGVCFRCHGDTKTSGGLRVDTLESLLRGGESGPALVAGKPDESLLMQAIRRKADVSAMPPDKDKALRPDEVAAFETWIQSGAIWPGRTAKFEAVRHWAFEPARAIAVPAVKDADWVKNSVDAFIRAKQEEIGLSPASEATKRALIRRATFDLTGLPPTADEIAAFEKDTSIHAFEKVVDRLLASPRYGERWGRHWLDVARYADTAGETADYPAPHAWRYRNYVIDAFNADKPYNEFLQEQIAGDVLAEQGPRSRYAERATATGFLAISRRFGFDSENYHHLTIQDTIDTLGQTAMGLSLGCARCHDHKYDPVSMTDYYGLYGIFDSSRYSFPGSEQKPKVRSLLPLAPLRESAPVWGEFQRRVALVSASLEKRKQSVPAATLRSLNDIDGDFELQAPANGGSKGVLVSPWMYEGNISVTNGAQSPFKNLYGQGRNGVNVAAGAGKYDMSQALRPRRTAENCRMLYVNLDLRIAGGNAATKGVHRFWLGSAPASAAVEVLISSESVAMRLGDKLERMGPLKGNTWNNLQLTFDLKNRTVSCAIGQPGNLSELGPMRLAESWSGTMDYVSIDSNGSPDLDRPAAEFDNLGVQESPISPVSTEIPDAVVAKGVDPVALKKELQNLEDIDGDLELQTEGAALGGVWNPGPKSVVAIDAKAQSPFQNLYASGKQGLHMPNRGEYDGFGLSFSHVRPKQTPRLFASFDFRCAKKDAGGNGSWRYYIGHDPGASAAVELFFNAHEFVHVSGGERTVVCPLVVGEWYQVQLQLDLEAKSYKGLLAWRSGKQEFAGQLATGWDGTLNYLFIDSHGHLGGIRPALDVDNFVIREQALTHLDERPNQAFQDAAAARLKRVRELRSQLASLSTEGQVSTGEFRKMLAEGPYAMAYGVTEGTPHNVRIHLRGEPSQPGAEAPRGFLKALGGNSLPDDTEGSGRLELALWLTRAEHPLTARVMVNRIWQYHFGQGLVKTPNDFGIRGMRPTHPELLDYLATQFVKSGWSVKAMHRLLMLSATYRESSEPMDTARAPPTEIDAHDVYTRFFRRRLSAEEIRDSILMVSGELDWTPGRGHPFPEPVNWGFTQHNPFSAVYDHDKRSIYLMAPRLKRHPFLSQFDGADPNASTAERRVTVVPTQALFFLNDPFVHMKAEKWAARLQAAHSDPKAQIDSAWQSACGRPPTEVESLEATNFLTAFGAEAASLGQANAQGKALAAYVRTLFGSNEFLHID